MAQDYTTREREDNWGNTYPAPLIASGSKEAKRVPIGNATKRVWTGRQITTSRGHRKSHDGKYHEGGDFFSFHCQPEIPTRFVNMYAQKKFDHYFYDGPLTVPHVPVTMGGFLLPSQDSSYLDPVGAEAISIVDPANPNAETGVALGEILKDGRIPIPGIQAWKRRTEIAKAAGSEFLNAVFGWQPLVKDILDTVQSIQQANTIMGNYVSASGTDVHREFEFDPVISVKETVVGKGRADYGNVNIPAFNGVSPEVDLAVTEHKHIKRWFSGSFTYHADADSTPLQRMMGYGSEADKLFGLALTPDIVWELAPWSWAIDWFSNAQQVISNVGSFELAGLIMRYGYIMEETSIVNTYSMPNVALTGVTGTVPPARVAYTVKRRRAANPFGFGLDWDGLSPTQLAITVALGITRLL
jgi:hypothetical protein